MSTATFADQPDRDQLDFDHGQQPSGGGAHRPQASLWGNRTDADGPYQPSRLVQGDPVHDPYAAHQPPTADLPVDPDVDLHISAQRAELRALWPVLTAISAGGAIGALARWAIGFTYPTPLRGFPWTTFAINVSGSLLIGILMVLVTQVFTENKLVRPFLGVGILGGYTTFSTYIIESNKLINANAAGVALAYLAGTLVAALCATAGGVALTRLALRLRRAETEAAQ